MDQFLEKDWINDRQWEYYIIQIDLLLSSKILKDEHQKLFNIYKKYSQSKKVIPIQLQEYINVLSVDKNCSHHRKDSIDPFDEYKRVLLVASVLRRQEIGLSKINAIDLASKYFKVSPKIFFQIYSKYFDRAKNYIMVEPDTRGLDKILGL